MKKWFALLLCAMILGALPFATAFADYMYINTSGGSVNMRSEPDEYADVMCRVPNGSLVNVLEYVYGSPWANCDYNGYYGYINSRYLSSTPPGPTPGPIPVPTYHPNPTARPNPTVKPAPNPAKKGIYSGFTSAFYTAVVQPGTPNGFVHMRWAPVKDAPIFADYYGGSVLWVLYSNGTWCQVLDPNTYAAGYMMQQFLAYTGPISGGLGANSGESVGDYVNEEANVGLGGG